MKHLIRSLPPPSNQSNPLTRAAFLASRRVNVYVHKFEDMPKGILAKFVTCPLSRHEDLARIG